ncbi:rhodanese-like domain-containing protein [Flammeovirgaceae bacterium SG7u.111]|nr:rhodanese-like domain-containing protein [Flammeovirgaceae bacterium SG7u.132]WPO38623.1 rhodanese-like domain-containing protein [Flammeovirgaceae bacterium SG7u.111]
MFGFLKKMLGGPSVDLGEVISQGAVIIDVRTPGEYKSGHVKGSVNIPLDKVSANIDKIKKYNKPIITCCASGMRSGSAASILRKNGLEEVYNGGSWGRVNNLKR